ncbi:MAG: dolichyl-phosphate beta-glucosyltransferase [Anaerolineales bacterium]
MAPLLSIVIPAHNEEARLPITLPRVLAHMDSRDYETELVIVDSGSDDRTGEIAADYAQSRPDVRWFRVDLPGKGLAVRTGMLASQGEYRFICDADLSMPIEQVDRFLPPQLDGPDIAIASREAPGAVRYGEPFYRHLIGRGFNTLVRALAIPRLQDTQCGFKCFRGEVAENVFRRQCLEGWTFDVEVLYIALGLGYQVVEVPIPWYYNAGSRVHVFNDSVAMFLDLFRIRLYDWRGDYRLER